MPPKEDGVEEHEKEPTVEDVMLEDAPMVVPEDPPSVGINPRDDFRQATYPCLTIISNT
jgi:hypothetical protein